MAVLSLGQAVLIGVAVGFLGLGLILWRLEARNPALLDGFENGTWKRWPLPITLIAIVCASPLVVLLQHPWGGQIGIIPLALIDVAMLAIAWGWLRMHPGSSKSP